MNGRASRGDSTPTSALQDPMLLAAVTLGAFVRVLPAVGTDFPIGDGGLVASMIDQVANNGLAPPDRLDYNAANIPFAYPPVAVYLAAVPALLGVATLDLLRVLPVVLAILVIPAWYFLARDLFGVRTAAIAAMLYALTPKSYEWLIAGGGLTRGLGLLFVVSGLTGCLLYFRQRTIGRVSIAGGLLGLGALSHPEAGVFGLATMVLLAWVRRAGWRSVFAVATIALAVTVPWLLRIAALYGATPFISAGGSRTESYIPVIVELASLRFTHEPILGVVAVLGTIGGFVAMTSSRTWVLIWLLVCVLLVPAAALTLLMLPWSALGAMALQELIGPRLSRRTRRLGAAIGAAFLVVGCAWSPVLPYSPIWSVSPAIRDEADRLANRVPAGTAIAVVTGSFWPIDTVAEWLPYLTQLESVGTVQGFEFSGRWAERLEAQEAIADCADETASCLIDALGEHAPGTELAFIPEGRLPGHAAEDCCPALRATLRYPAMMGGSQSTMVFLLPTP